MSLLPDFALRPPVKVLFAPSDRFFLRVVPLAAGSSVAAQAELALEGLAPFPPAQLYWGCRVAPGGKTALVYAAHRRRFTAEETAAWADADLVVPDLLALLGSDPAGAALRLARSDSRLLGVAWSGDGAGPVAAQARGAGEETGDFVTSLAARAGLKEAPAAAWLAGTPAARREGAELVLEFLDVAGTAVVRTAVPAETRELLDVRDRAFLAERRRQRGRSDLVWRALLAGLGLAGVAGLCALGAVAFAQAARLQRAGNAAREPLVAHLATMHSLASKLDELTGRRLRFFEMVDTVNRPRPTSIVFTRVATHGRTGLEVEAQTKEASDIGAYEAALRKLPGLEHVETRDVRSREGLTTFGLVTDFRPEPAKGGTP